MKIRHREMVVGMIFAAPCIAGFAVFFAVPFIISLFYCFTEGISAIGFVGFDNFKGLLESGSFRLAAMNTLKFNLISVPFILMLSLAIALLLNSRLKYISIFKSLFILPLVIPVVARADLFGHVLEFGYFDSANYAWTNTCILLWGVCIC